MSGVRAVVVCAHQLPANTVNWEKFSVNMLAKPTTKINSQNFFYSTKVQLITAVMNGLLLTQFTTSPHSRCPYFKVKDGFQILKGGCQHVCQRKWSPLETKWLSREILLFGAFIRCSLVESGTLFAHKHSLPL